MGKRQEVFFGSNVFAAEFYSSFIFQFMFVNHNSAKKRNNSQTSNHRPSLLSLEFEFLLYKFL